MESAALMKSDIQQLKTPLQEIKGQTTAVSRTNQ